MEPTKTAASAAKTPDADGGKTKRSDTKKDADQAAGVQPAAPVTITKPAEQQSAKEWSIFSSEGEQPIDRVWVLVFNTLGLISAVSMIYIAYLPKTSPTMGAVGLLETTAEAWVLLPMIGLFAYLVFLIHWWPANLAAKYRWYWVRNRDFRVVSDTQMPFASHPYSSTASVSHNCPVQNSVALRLHIGGTFGGHQFVVAFPSDSFCPPEIPWEVKGYDGRCVTIGDRAGCIVTVTPQLALRMAQFPNLESYWRTLEQRSRARNGFAARIQRLRQAAQNAQSKVLSLKKPTNRSNEETVLKNYRAALVGTGTDLLQAADDDRQIQPQCDAGLNWSVGREKDCSGVSSQDDIRNMTPPVALGWVVVMHILFALMCVLGAHAVQVLVAASQLEGVGLGRLGGGIAAAILAFILFAAYLIWFLVGFNPHNLSRRFKWHWHCIQCGPVTTVMAPEEVVRRNRGHRPVEKMPVIRQRVSGYSKEPACVFTDEGAGVGEWSVGPAQWSLLDLTFGIEAPRLSFRLPPAIALRLIQHDDPTSYWLELEHWSEESQNLNNQVNNLQQGLRDIRAHLILPLSRTDDVQVIAAELTHLVEELSVVSGASMEPVQGLA